MSSRVRAVAGPLDKSCATEFGCGQGRHLEAKPQGGPVSMTAFGAFGAGGGVADFAWLGLEFCGVGSRFFGEIWVADFACRGWEIRAGARLMRLRPRCLASERHVPTVTSVIL